MPRITDCCSCIYVFGCRLSLVRLCDSDFGITPVDDITIGITCAALLLLLLLLLHTTIVRIPVGKSSMNFHLMIVYTLRCMELQ